MQREGSLKQELQSLFKKAKLPTNPAVAARILTLIDDPLSTADHFAELIETDPALAGRLLQMANSEHYFQQVEATTVQRAVTLIGLRQLRLFVLGFELVGHLDRLGDTDFDLQGFWQESLLRACLCRQIAAKVVPSHAEEAFLIGLLQDCGVPLLVQILGTSYARLFEEYRGSPLALNAQEQRFFPYTHVDAVLALASMWNLPSCFTLPLGMQHTYPGEGEPKSAMDQLVSVSYLVGSIGFFVHDRDASINQGLRSYARHQLHLTREDIEDSFVSSEAMFGAVSTMFSDTAPQDVQIIDLISEAKRKLVTEAIHLQHDLKCVQSDLSELEAERSNLADSLAQYRERAARDPLTGVLNRGALVEMTDSCLCMATEQQLPIAMFFLDIDDFKKVNDEYGHAAGDDVLKNVAASLVQTAGDAVVGRYGGEEFVIIVPGLTARETEEMGQRLVGAVRHTRFHKDRLPRSVSCSIGAVWAAPRSLTTSDVLFAMTDELMYQAKRSGKGCARFGVLDDAESKLHSSAEEEDADGSGINPPTQNNSHDLLDEELQQVAEMMNQTQESVASGVRKHYRHRLLAPCTVRYFVDRSLRLQQMDSLARDISSGGVSLLIGRPFVRGDLVEVALERDADRIYLAGTVAHCNCIDGRIHNVGVQLSQQAREPIFLEDAELAVNSIEWIVQALTERYGKWHDPRHVA